MIVMHLLHLFHNKTKAQSKTAVHAGPIVGVSWRGRLTAVDSHKLPKGYKNYAENKRLASPALPKSDN